MLQSVIEFKNGNRTVVLNHVCASVAFIQHDGENLHDVYLNIDKQIPQDIEKMYILHSKEVTDCTPSLLIEMHEVKALEPEIKLVLSEPRFSRLLPGTSMLLGTVANLSHNADVVVFETTNAYFYFKYQ